MKDDPFDRAYMQAVGEFLSEKRKMSGRTLDDIAFVIDIKWNTLYKYERGDRQIPIEVLQKLCRFYNVDFLQTFRDINNRAIDIMMKELKK